MIHYLVIFLCSIFLFSIFLSKILSKKKTIENFKTNYYSTLTTQQFLDFVKRDSITDGITSTFKTNFGDIFDDYTNVSLLISNVTLGIYQNNYNLSTNQNQYQVPAVNLPTYQKACGCCYAHAFTCILESWYFLNVIKQQGGNTLIKLSIQQIIDCCTSNGYANGCDGASFSKIVKYFDKPVYIAYNESYEYTSDESFYDKNKGKDDCADYTQFMTDADPDIDFITVPSLTTLTIVDNKILKNIDIIKKIIYASGPVYISVYISIDRDKAYAFSNYPLDTRSNLPYSGDYYDFFPAEGDPDASDEHGHAMVLVGWKDDYWIIRNSYGYYDNSKGIGNYWGINGNGYLYSHFDKFNLYTLGIIIQNRPCIPKTNISIINNTSIYWVNGEVKESVSSFNIVAFKTDSKYKFLFEIKCTSNLIYYKNISSTQQFIEITNKSGDPLTNNLKNYYNGSCDSKKQDDNGNLFYIKDVELLVVETADNEHLDLSTLNIGQCVWHIKLSIINTVTTEIITFSQIDIDWKNAEEI